MAASDPSTLPSETLANQREGAVELTAPYSEVPLSSPLPNQPVIHSPVQQQNAENVPRTPQGSNY